MAEQLSNPAYQHLLINHLPIIGIVMGLVGLCVAFALRQRVAFIPALVILVVAGVSAWPVYATGSEAYKPIRQITDDAGIDWLDTHIDRADSAIWAFYVLAGVAAVAVAVPWKWPRASLPLAILTTVIAVACLGAAGWIAEAGGKVRHPEFRTPGTSALEISETHDRTD